MCAMKRNKHLEIDVIYSIGFQPYIERDSIFISFVFFAPPFLATLPLSFAAISMKLRRRSGFFFVLPHCLIFIHMRSFTFSVCQLHSVLFVLSQSAIRFACSLLFPTRKHKWAKTKQEQEQTQTKLLPAIFI